MSSDNDFKRKINVIDKQYLGKKKKSTKAEDDSVEQREQRGKESGNHLGLS